MKKTYSDYLGLGYEVVSAYFADGYHFQVLQSKEDVVIAHMPHGKIMADGFLMDSDVQITRVMK
ncbi:hypothetical protein [Fretibacter rubidus]|uniref:hypothetical protein n=1 Tax=Fretibacter rubidus TaxID=570162 RepID=UPI00352B216C